MAHGSMESMVSDVAIVGGGVAGAALGARLAGAGLGVVIAEREARFRDRVRGEGIHPWGVREAARLGLLPALGDAGAQELPLWQPYEDRVPAEPYRWADDDPDGVAEWSVGHPALQEASLACAERRGARVLRPAQVVGYRRSDGSVLTIEHQAGPVEIRARLVVGADGRRSVARRWIGAETERDPVHHAVGGCLFAGAAVDPERAHDATFPGGRALLFPQRGDLARAYLIVTDAEGKRIGRDGAAGFRAALAARFPEGALHGAEARGPAAFFPNADIWSSRLAGAGVVLVGDAAGANDPSLGQGLSLAFWDARVLGDLLGAERDWELATRAFTEARARVFDTVRQHARWTGSLVVDEGPEADARRDRVARARETDPGAGGFASIIARGPEGLVADEDARRRFFGEDRAA